MPLLSKQYKVVLELVNPASVRAASSPDSHCRQARSKVLEARLRDQSELLSRPQRKLWTSSGCLRINPKAVQLCHHLLSRPSRLLPYHELHKWQPPVFPSLQALRSQLPRLVLRARMSIPRRSQRVKRTIELVRIERLNFLCTLPTTSRQRRQASRHRRCRRYER